MNAFYPVVIFLSLAAYAQAQQPGVLQFEKVSIPECGCSVYLPKGTLPFEISLSQDSSQVFIAEYETADTLGDNYVFSVIAVRFKDETGADRATNEDLLIAYMEFIKEQLEIVSSAGYGRGHTLEGFPDATGIIDFWSDAEGYEYKVKGWIDGKKLGLLLLGGSSEYPYYNAQEVFLNGFRFE